MVSQGADILKDENILLTWPFDNLDFAFSVIKADSLFIAHDDKLFKRLNLELLIWSLLLLLLTVILVPLEIYTSILETFEIISRIEKRNFIQMWKHEDVAKNVIVIIVPRILISVLDHNLFGLYIHNLELLLFEVSNRQVIVRDTEAKAVSTETLMHSKSYLFSLKYGYLL